ncbi:uncharacterized protein LOC134832695 [Culicoides brevitarsis]|uniref:uncharacterized protein LOC134832695 n=1 Tax=Culicoides brevitarsis TaxID=469753 RepID=UPI00307BD046
MNRKPLRDINTTEIASPSKMSTTNPGRTLSRHYSAKREAPEDNETPVKRQKTREEPQESSDPDNAFSQNIANVLGKHYFDVVGRLQLTAPPECVVKLGKCTQNHSASGKNNKNPAEFDEFMTREIAAFVTDGKIDVFFEQLSNIVMKGEFLGESLLQLMLETMLATNESKFQENYSEAIQETGHDIFMQTMKKFPPCWTKVRDRYFRLMTDPLQLETFQNKREYETDKGLFNLLILLLEHNLRNDDEASPSTSRQNINDTMDMNFAAWEEHTKQTYDFKKNSRNEKMERIFRVLGLLVNLMERDLAIWMLRNPRNIQKGLQSDKKPLIAALLWPTEVFSLNYAVKRIMKVFIECVHLNYPTGDLEVLSRLMNLIATCVNVAEFRTDFRRFPNITVEYPSINKNTEFFARELKRLMDDFPHFSITLYANVLKNLRTPCIKSVLARQILTRINPCKDTLKPGRDTPLHLLMSSLNHRDWRDADPRPPTSPTESDETSSKYPTMPPKATSRKKAFDIYREDLIAIQLTEVESHMNLYRVNDVYNTLRTPLEFNDDNNNNEPETKDFAEFNTKMLKNLLQHVKKVQFSSEELPKNDPLAKVFKSINLSQKFILNYREQIKLCYHLQCFFDKAVDKYPELADFQAYFNEKFTKE